MANTWASSTVESYPQGSNTVGRFSPASPDR